MFPVMPDKTLVAYATKSGATATYAETIAQVLISRGHPVDVINLTQLRKPDLGPYRNVVLGTGVRIGMVYRRATRFLRRKDLRGKRLAVFLSSGIAIADTQRSKQQFLEPLISKYDLNPMLYDAFPGKTPGAGQENTLDLKGVARWAEALAAQLSLAAADG